MIRSALLAAVVAFFNCLFIHAADDRPNLIWIMADDLGYGEIGCFGQKVIQTPRIDEMAREGLRLTHFYAGATVCAPSRSVLMTGLHHGHTRVRGNAGATNPEAQTLLPGDTTVADVLHQAGYRTALCGKWGLGDFGAAEAGLPWKHGFDLFFGYLNQRHAHNHFTDHLWRNDQRVNLPNVVIPIGGDDAGYSLEPKVFADDLMAQESLKFVEENRDHPFFLYWSPVVPHANNERAKELGDGANVPDYGPYADKDWPNPDKGHAAMITRLDGYVGQMLDLLNRLDLAKKTLVIFTSDNGPHNESRHNLDRFQPSGPFSGIKRSLKDGGIRVPFVAWWPGVIKPNTASDYVSGFVDWFPTAADLAKAKVPDNLDGISLVPLLTGHENAQKKRDFLYWEFHEGSGFSQAALYDGRWKGIRQGGPDAPLQLFDQKEDVAELVNVARDHPDIVAKIDTYLKTARTDNPNWKPVWNQGKGAKRAGGKDPGGKGQKANTQPVLKAQ